MSYECGFVLFMIGIGLTCSILFLIPIPIVYWASSTLHDFGIRCSNSSMPEVRIIPFDISGHTKLELSFPSTLLWPEGVDVSMYDPRTLGPRVFFNSHSLEMKDVILDNRSSTPIGYYSLGRDSVISVSFSAMHSLTLALIRRDDYDPVFNSRSGDSRFYETYQTTMLYQRTSHLANDFTNLSKSIFQCHNRTCNVSWNVPETTQYSLLFINESPFPLTVYGCNVSMKCRSPLENPLFVCETKTSSCTLRFPDDYDKETISIVMSSDCAHTREVLAVVEMNPSGDEILFSTLCFLGPPAIGIILVVIGLCIMLK